jgi:hypothetical protein
MKQLMGCVAAVALLASAAAANAQVPLPLRIGSALVTTASDVVGATISTVSDFGGSYAAMSPEIGPRYGYAPPLLPPQEVYAILRENGFSPLGAPQQRGLVYTISAIDPDGEDGRVVIDGRNGRIVRFMPAYRMGSRMGEEVVTTYGPVGALPPMPADRRALPRPPAAVPRLASRTPNVPLPKALPPRAVAAPKAAATPAPVTPAPVQQSAVVPPKTDDVRVIPLTPTPAATTAAPVAPTVAVPPVEAKPATPAQPAETMPPVQGLE